MNAKEHEYNTDKNENSAVGQVSEREQPLFQRITIIGVGLMGGSLGLALRARHIAQTVVGVDTSAPTLTRAQEMGAIDEGTTDLRAGVQSADCVLLAAPVGVILSLLPALVSLAPPDALITDIGSTKRWIVDTGESCFGERFVGGHPMAGAPAGGIEAARADVFAGAAWGIVGTKLPDIDANRWAAKLAAMTTALDARPVLLNSAQHDRLVALVSHLPHLLSFAFADMIAGQPDVAQAQQMAGSSFRDLTRVAVADRAFWQDIFAQNRDALRLALAEYEARLEALKRALEE